MSDKQAALPTAQVQIDGQSPAGTGQAQKRRNGMASTPKSDKPSGGLTGRLTGKSSGLLERVPPYLHGWILPIGVVVLWQLSGTFGWISADQLPAPTAIIKSYYTEAENGELWRHLFISLKRVIFGFSLGTLTGLLLGLFTGLGRIAGKMLDPSLQMLRTVPLLALIPLFILWFGIGEFSKILMISLGAFFPVYVNTYLGVRSVESKLYQVTQILNYSTWQRLTKLILPSALPNVLLGFRLAAGNAWLVLVVAEMMATSAGIGYMIQDARTYTRTDIVFAGILIFALAGRLSDLAVRRLEKKWLGWRDVYKG